MSTLWKSQYFIASNVITLIIECVESESYFRKNIDKDRGT